MSLSYALALQDASAESTREAIACTNGIGNLYLWSLLERNLAWGEDVTSVHAASQHEHIKTILAENQPALILNVQTRIAEEATDGNQLLIVDLQDIATLQALTDNILVVEVLTEVDVEYLQAITRCMVEEVVNHLAAHLTALSQRTPANGSGIASDLLDFIGEWDVVPSHALLDVVSRHALSIEAHLHRTSREAHLRHHILQLLLVQLAKSLITQGIIAYRTHCHGVQTMLTSMISEVGRSTTKFTTCWEDIKENLTQAYTIFLVQISIHNSNI